MASNYWSKDWYLEFSASLAANVSANPKLLGVVLVGSTSDTSRVDEWSDHDFFLITQEGEGETFRQDLSWLPLENEIAWAVRETAHGLKVVYNFGHVLEFAVFNESELELAKLNAATVASDKAKLTARVDALREASKPTTVANLQSELDLLLSHILTGVGRFRRGEVLIAGEQIRSYLMGNLLTLISHWVAPVPGSESTEDNLNRFRRFERRYPVPAERIAAALAGDVDSAARRILELVEAADPTEDNHGKYRVVRDRLGWN